VRGFSTAEVTTALDASPAAVNSSLQRARATLASAAPSEDLTSEPQDTAVRETVERYVRAFESADVDALVTLLTEDVVLEMPPVPLWYFRRRRLLPVHHPRLRPARRRLADAPDPGQRQTALAAYCPDDAGTLRLHTLQVLTISHRAVAHNVVFQDPRVFTAFDLAPVLGRPDWPGSTLA
jgi:RNA polymerase sigma-70 factor (ECF subfamily)